MKLFVDLETLQLIEGPGFRNPVTALRFKRGDAARLEVVFLTNGTTPATIGNPASLELRFGVKPRGRYDVGYLVHTADWTPPDPGAQSPVYQCAPSFNTLELDSALGVGSSDGSELAEITLMGEITWREGTGEPTSTRTFTVIVENDVNRGDEGTPLANSTPDEWLDSSAVRHDKPQTLTVGQQARFWENLGGEPGGGGMSGTTDPNGVESAVPDTITIAGITSPAGYEGGVVLTRGADVAGFHVWQYSDSGYNWAVTIPFPGETGHPAGCRTAGVRRTNTLTMS